MARPVKENADYFPHYAEMRNDRRIQAVRKKFGLEGYAVYNMLIESLTSANNFFITLDEAGVELEMISGDFGIDSKLLVEMLDYFQKMGLIQREDTEIRCAKLNENLAPLVEKRKKMRQKHKKKAVSGAGTRVSDAETTQSIVEYSRVYINSKLFIYEAKVFHNKKKRDLYDFVKDYMIKNKSLVEAWLFNNFKNCTEEILDIVARNFVFSFSGDIGVQKEAGSINSLLFSLLDHASKNLEKFPQGGQAIKHTDINNPFKREVKRIQNRYPELANAKFCETSYNSLRNMRNKVESEILTSTNRVCSDLVKYKRNKANIFIEVKDGFNSRRR